MDGGEGEGVGQYFCGVVGGLEGIRKPWLVSCVPNPIKSISRKMLQLGCSVLSTLIARYPRWPMGEGCRDCCAESK
jgi:hypothetical protein